LQKEKQPQNKRISDSELLQLIAANKKIYWEHYDPVFLRNLIDQVMAVVDETYFRSRFVGFSELPQRNNPKRPLIYAGNHTGMSFPWDAMIFVGGFFKKHGYDTSKSLRTLTAPMLSKTALMNPFLMKDVWKKAGGIDATTLNFETMMEYQDSDLLIYPEGVPGIGKGFNKRYQLQKFSTSFLRMSIKYKTDIIPFATINGEYINPYSYSFPWLNNLANKIGIPFFPIGILTLLLLFQPWLFYSALPAKLIFVRGERLKPYEMIDKPFPEITRADLEDLRDNVHLKMQAQLDEAVKTWGNKPYQMKEFWQKFIENIGKFPYNLPFGWPLIFSEFERKYYRTDQKPVKLKLGFLSTLRIMIQNPITIAFFIPLLGWIPLLIKGYRHKDLP